MALITSDNSNIVLIDQRMTSIPLGYLPHDKQVTCAAWNPLSKDSLATSSDDKKI